MDVEATAKRAAWKLNDQTDCHDPNCLIGHPESVAEIIAAEFVAALESPGQPQKTPEELDAAIARFIEVAGPICAAPCEPFVRDDPEYQAADLSPEQVAARLNEVKWRGREDWQVQSSLATQLWSKSGRCVIDKTDARAIAAGLDAQRELAILRDEYTNLEASHVVESDRHEIYEQRLRDEIATLRADYEQAQQQITGLVNDREGLEKEVERLSAENERLRRIAIVENQAVGQLRAARTERPAPTGELDLDAIEARIEEWKVTPKIQKGVQLIERDIPALLALVRRLRTEPATGTWAWALVQMCQERQNSTKGRVVHRPGRADVEINDEGVVMSGQPFLAADFDATDWQLTEEEP